MAILLEVTILMRRPWHEYQKHTRFALGIALFQVGIVLASVSLLVRFRWLHALSLVTGVVGLLCLIAGLLS